MSDEKYSSKRRRKYRPKSLKPRNSTQSANAKEENNFASMAVSNVKFSKTEDSLTNRNTPDSSNFLNSSGMSQLQKFMNATDSDTVPIDAVRRKASNLLRNKYKLLRNVNRLTPVMNLNGKRLNSPETSQTSNINDIENEIDNLFKYAFRPFICSENLF